MFRKLALGFVATASLGLAALAPTTASACEGGFNVRHGSHDNGFRDRARNDRGFQPGGYHRGWYGARAQFRGRGCLQQRLVPTPFGPRYRTVNVCR